MSKKKKQNETEVVFQVAQQDVPPQAPVQKIQFQPDVPIAQPVGKPKGQEFQCPQCSKIFIVALSKRPAYIKCPYCGLEGIVE